MLKGDCNICINGKMPSYSATCVECGLSRKNYKPITNADRIRAMTDEELAEWATLMVCKYRSCGNCPMSDWCSPGRGIAEWLKSPVEGEE